MTTSSTLKRAALALALVGSMIIASASASHATPAAHAANLARPVPPTPTPTGPTAYVGKLTCCKNLVLGPQSTPTFVVSTPPLPAGNYLVNVAVQAVIADHDQIVCAVGPSSGGGDGIYGTAGNGSGTMGDGGMIYGTTSIADSWVINTAGDSLQVVCNSFNYGLGTYVPHAEITALTVGALNVQSS